MGQKLRNDIGGRVHGRPWRRLVVVSALVGSLAFAGFSLAGSLGTTGVSLTPTGPVPQTITANWGDTVAFVNADTVGHSLLSARPELNTPTTVAPGATFTTMMTGRTRTYQYSDVQGSSGNRLPGYVSQHVTGTISLKASKLRLIYGEKVTLSGIGTLTPVVVTQKLHGQPEFKPLQTLVPGTDGSYSLTIAPTLNTRYRAAIAGGQLRSRDVILAVAPQLKVSSQAKKTKANHKVTITSRITPADAATKITLLTCNTKHGGWTGIALKKPTASGSVTFTWPAQAGTNYLKTTVTQANLTEAYATPTSNTIKIQAIAPKPKKTKHPKAPKPANPAKPSRGCAS